MKVQYRIFHNKNIKVVKAKFAEIIEELFDAYNVRGEFELDAEGLYNGDDVGIRGGVSLLPPSIDEEIEITTAHFAVDGVLYQLFYQKKQTAPVEYELYIAVL